MQHLAAFYSNVDQGGNPGFIAGVVDQALTVDGNDIRVPNELTGLQGGALVTAATTVTSAQFQSPSLRNVFYPSIAPLGTSDPLNNPPPALFMPANPSPLDALEDMNFVTNTDNAAAVDIYGLMWLTDGPQGPVNGDIRTIRATTSIGLTAGSWTNGALTFDQVLPVGDYQIVGIRAEGTGLVAARVVIQGYSWRPGVPGRAAVSDVDIDIMRLGRSGVLGTFNNNTPPTIDAIGDTGTDQVIYLDLIKVS